MKKRTILVTGAASGIGFGVASYLASQGHRLWLSDLPGDGLTSAANKLESSGAEVSMLELDVTSEDSMERLTHQLKNKPIDVLINNAGIQHVSALEDFPIEKWNALIQIMLVGVARLSQAVLPTMRTHGFGRIINIGSIHSLVASPYKSAYVAAKHGLLGFSKVVALETCDVDITINTVCPSYVETPLVQKQIAAQAKENHLSEDEVINEIMLKPMPKSCFITIDELAETCAFLMSAHARNITGQTIVLDGGWTAR